MEYSNDVEQRNIKEYENDKKMWILRQDIRAKERYAEILLWELSGRGETYQKEETAGLD